METLSKQAAQLQQYIANQPASAAAPAAVAVKPKITSAFPNLKAFLESSAVEAPAALRVLQDADILLRQLPNFTTDQLVQLGLRVGTVDRIRTEAAKYSAA